MKLKIIIGTLFICIGFFGIIVWGKSAVLTAEGEFGGVSPTNIIFQRRGEASKIDADLLAVHGPQICTSFGDAFSPWNSIYAPDSYSYHYRISIPADYVYEIVRIEIFDPDSINNDEDGATVVRSALVQDSTVVSPPLAPTAEKFCGVDSTFSAQIYQCALSTNELDYWQAPLTLDQINPYWFVRVDKNRGDGDPSLHGNGDCAEPNFYEAGYNTQTVYELFYDQLVADDVVERSSLVRYTGQTGDNRDVDAVSLSPGDHNTDLFWISPGAENQGSDFDALYGTFHVPVDAGSTADSFEIDLTTDVPNIWVESETGERVLYLDITAVSGASENAFAIWAGPPNYAISTPADINARNVLVTNSPTAHDSGGVTITAVEHGIMSSVGDINIARPIAYIPPNMRGGAISISHFDVDTLSQPPMVFYFDTIPEADWSKTFGQDGVPDPDGVPAGVRCLPGNCQDEWVDPAYEIVVPGLMENCDSADEMDDDCLPFYGGTLMVRYAASELDTSTWEIMETAVPQPPTSNSCAAYPVGVGSLVRSVTAPATGSTPYPDSSEFDYPPVPPNYASFATHQPNILLDDDTPAGTVFRYELGSSPQSFSWLVWNQLIVPTDSTLSNSLNPPGNSADYTNYGDAGTPHPNYGYVVRGYAEPGNVNDISLHVDNLIARSPAQLSTDITFGAVNQMVNDHIDHDRLLLLPVYSESETAVNTIVAERFGLFNLVGYGNAGQGDEWLLAEFVRWDESCGQLEPPPPPTYENYLPWLATP